jgi:hypothetical protein
VDGSPLDAVVEVAAAVLVFALLVKALTGLKVPSVSVAVARAGVSR